MQRKSIPSKANANAIDGNGLCNWTCPMDDAIVDAYLQQHMLGNRVGGTFTTHASDTIIKELKENFLDKPIDKEKAQNRMKT